MYKIPNRKKNLITDEFLNDFKKEMDIIFKLNGNKTYYDFYSFASGTSGVYNAFKIASERAIDDGRSKGFFKYYRNLTWEDSDWFMDELFEIMIKKNVMKLGKCGSSEYEKKSEIPNL